MSRWGRLLLLHLAAAALVVGAVAVAEAQSTSRAQSGSGQEAAPTRGDRLAVALPAPLDGHTARERIEDNAETGQVRVQRVYLDADGKPVIAIAVRSETPATLEKRKRTFMDPAVVRARKGEFREISGRRFAIVKIQGEYTAATFVDGRYSVLFFGTSDRTTLMAHIASTDFGRIGAVP
ncbi:MAG: hypothetical protein OXH59_17740 [Rhodospirillaceae bacterium]|nr:hypothetical protein [Rhodospirillaceae bacterium]